MSFARRFETSLRQLAHYEPFLFPREEIPPEFQRAAVLIPFWPQDGGLRTVLTRRSTRIRAHKGQVSFAGGRLDPGESWEQAALREAHEEIGIEPDRVEVIGRLDDAWSGAGHHVVPIVGWLAAPPVLVANEREVAEILVARRGLPSGVGASAHTGTSSGNAA